MDEESKRTLLKQLQQEFHTASKNWRKQINNLHYLLVNERDVETLEQGTQILIKFMNELAETQERLDKVKESEVEKITLFGRFETMSNEINVMLKEVGAVLSELIIKKNDDDRQSIASSRYSRKSRSSRGSASSTTSSTRQRRIDLEEELASLKARMDMVKVKENLDIANRKALQEIERKKMEIEREEKRIKEQIENATEKYKISKELAEKKARIDVCKRFEEELVLPDLQDNDHNSVEEHIRKFLDTQPNPAVKVPEILDANDQPMPTSSNGNDRPTTSSPLNPLAHVYTSDMQSSSEILPAPPNQPPPPPPSTPRNKEPPTSPNEGTPPTIPNETPPNCMTEPATGSEEPPSNPDLLQVQLQTISRLLEIQNQNRLPLPEPGIFTGDPLKYPVWVKAFETQIESRAINSAEILHFLGKYVSGEAKSVVEGFMLLDGDDAYEKAKKQLSKRFGNSFAVASAFRKRLDGWAQVAPSDGLNLRKFADLLVQCETAMQKISSLKVLDDDQENHKMVSKLPRWAAVRWGRLVHNWKEEKDSFPPFSEFVKFVVKEADIACDPVNLRKINKEEDSKRPKNQGDGASGRKFPIRHERNPRNIMATNKSEETDPNDTNQARNEGPVANSCIFCKGHHELDSCEGFCNKDIGERKEYAKSKGFCFGCLRQGHLSKHYKNRKTCKACGKPHPSSLHGDIRTRDENKDDSNPPIDPASPTVRCTKTCLMNNGYQYQISSMIVPVWVNHADNPQNRKLVYALLDDQSDTTFVSQEVLDYLQVNGPKTQLSLLTMHAENELVRSERIKGLQVSDTNHSMTIKLPTTFSCETVPAKRQQIPCPEMANAWSHLKPIAHHLIPLNNDIPVGILIGSNCSQAIVPREVIPGKQNEPYAQRTDLGWGIIGNVGKSTMDEGEHLTGIVHRITTESNLPTLKPSARRPCHFSIRPTIKEVINPAQLREMLELDFSERGAEQPMSQEDKKFLSIMEGETRQREDGHYEMPLPFRQERPVLRNNKPLALHRLCKLQTRLENNKRYREDYITFMNELIEKNYAERVPQNELTNEDGDVWYIPHHGVYHPRKPEKIRVVFDCSATYQGESINNHLLQGPDLTNQLVGVLCRFRTEPTAFMCDVEAMFHQFKVFETHRNFLRFLWWEDGDTTQRPVEYRMTVHLFGAGSSPGCANYGLKKIADDYEEECGPEAANFVRNNFYVDDGLKSVKNTEQATTLIQRTKDLCARGGLRHHKFISNSKEVIAAIPQKDRASTLKNLDLHNDRLPTERALGVYWCVESDTFQMRITLHDTPLTRRGILSTISSIYDPLGFVAPVLLMGKQLLQELCRDRVDWDDPVPRPH